MSVVQAPQECINCGETIESETGAVWASSGLKESGLQELGEGETVGASELMDFDCGPFCSIDCSIKYDPDGGDEDA